MEVYNSIESFHKLTNAVVTPGTFDGVHKGHRKILSRLTEIAAHSGGESVVLTFHPHPRIVLQGEDSNLRLLTTMEEKTDLLREAGIDHFIIHPFTREFSRTNVVHYVRDMLCGQIGMKKLVIGYDHHFGRNREGNLENLLELAPLYEFEIEEIPAQEIDDVNVSSTKIRKALGKGDVQLANQYLGYSYRLSGRVTAGDQLGRKLGFPTANINVPDTLKMIPGRGVYAVRVLLKEGVFEGMLNIGVRPTTGASNEKETVEVHVLNFEGDLYEQPVTVEFVQRLRDEVRFGDYNELREQLQEDKKQVIRIFSQ